MKSVNLVVLCSAFLMGGTTGPMAQVATEDLYLDQLVLSAINNAHTLPCMTRLGLSLLKIPPSAACPQGGQAMIASSIEALRAEIISVDKVVERPEVEVGVLQNSAQYISFVNCASTPDSRSYDIATTKETVTEVEVTNSMRASSTFKGSFSVDAKIFMVKIGASVDVTRTTEKSLTNREENVQRTTETSKVSYEIKAEPFTRMLYAFQTTGGRNVVDFKGKVRVSGTFIGIYNRPGTTTYLEGSGVRGLSIESYLSPGARTFDFDGVISTTQYDSLDVKRTELKLSQDCVNDPAISPRTSVRQLDIGEVNEALEMGQGN